MSLNLFLTMVNIIADKYNMTAVINYKEQTVNFVEDYGEEVELKCAMELANVFKEGVVVRGRIDDKTI